MEDITKLKHQTITLKRGGSIVVIDPGATLGAESLAMIQALHSRSVGGVHEHLKTLMDRGSEKFMSSFYVGYGHKSIGDCGFATVFIEGVSMLAAKAIQDFPLYNGQEASTRYIDFAEQSFINPLESTEGNSVLENWRKFYLDAMPEMITSLKERYPLNDGEKENIYTKAIAARAFDILRGFLPAGASTNLAWSGNLRQFSDRIAELRHHPLSEVREISEALEDAMITAYPNSFSVVKKRFEETEEYNSSITDHYYYHDASTPEMSLVHDAIDIDGLEKYRNVFETKPNSKTELPKWLKGYGTTTFAFTLDFGSFRDIQRHRAVSQRMPLLTSEIGFEKWYLDELTDSLRAKALRLIKNQAQAVKRLTDDKYIQQYYQPMGYLISNRLMGDLPALVYLVELRSGSAVHPTLVKRAQEMSALLMKQYGKKIGLKLFIDDNSGRFDIRRGEHDIVEKKSK